MKLVEFMEHFLEMKNKSMKEILKDFLPPVLTRLFKKFIY